MAFKTLLVGIDLREGSRSALQTALRIAQHTQARVYALYVIEELLVHDLERELSHLDSNIRANLMSDAENAWSNFKRDVPGADTVTLDVQIAHPAAALTQQAASLNADLLVVGTEQPSRSGASELEMACLRKSNCHVLIARQDQARPFSHIIAGIDFSDQSRRVLEAAARVASYDKSNLTALHVFHGPWHKLHYRAPTPEASPKFEREYVEMLTRRLQEFCKLPTDFGDVKPQCRLVESINAGDGVVDESRRIKGDLIVLGAHGRSRLSDVLLGRTAERVLRETSSSVLVIK